MRASKTVRMWPYWMARAIRPPGRRAMCQARVRLNRPILIGPCGSSGMVWSGSPWVWASRLAQSTKDSIRLVSVSFFSAPCLPQVPWWAALSRSSPGGTIRSSTRIAWTTGVIATQGTRRTSPAEMWLPSSSVTFL